MNKYLVNDEFLYAHMKSAENIILDKLPKEDDLSHKYSKKFKRKMNRLLKEEKRSPSFNRFVNYGKKVAMIFLIVASVIFATTMSIEAYRARFFEKVIEILEDYTSITFDTDEDVVVEDLVPIAPEYIPEGFSVYEEEIHSTRNTVIYRNQEDIEIFYEQMILGHGQVILDTEGIEIEHIDIGSYEVMIFTNKGFTQLHWDNGRYMYSLISSIDRDELIKIAESIIMNN